MQKSMQEKGWLKSNIQLGKNYASKAARHYAGNYQIWY